MILIYLFPKIASSHCFKSSGDERKRKRFERQNKQKRQANKTMMADRQQTTNNLPPAIARRT
ncbi:hypothetical protein [Herbaspirillum lusitanum]|uniref:hypothetical protein n=1 Tax=Herbaspirillum lusitanum TaxID=213312 RepID=UPI000361FBCF|nr:hypothetical protein [Herbaspirillum lusitanum]